MLNVLSTNVNISKASPLKILESVNILKVWLFILIYVPQASKLSLHSIDEKPAEELPVLTPAELEEIKDANVIINKMLTLETRSAQIKPNLGAIAEYKKKVGINKNRHASIQPTRGSKRCRNQLVLIGIKSVVCHHLPFRRSCTCSV